MWTQVQFCKMGRVLEMDGGDGCTTQECAECHKIEHL